MSKEVDNALKHWLHIIPLITVPKNKKSYDQLVGFQDELLDLCADDDKHPGWGLVNLIADVISAYDEKNYPMPKASAVDVLKYLMGEHKLKQSDLSGLGSQGVVSEILNKKRTLNVKQIKWLCNRFKLSADTFIDLDDEKISNNKFYDYA